MILVYHMPRLRCSVILQNFDLLQVPVRLSSHTSGKTQTLTLEFPWDSVSRVFLIEGYWLVNYGRISLPFRQKSCHFPPLEEVSFVLDKQQAMSRWKVMLFGQFSARTKVTSQIGLRQIAPQGSQLLPRGSFTFVTYEKDDWSTAFRRLFIKRIV